MHKKIIKTSFINTGASPSSKLQVDDDDVLSEFIVKQKQKTKAINPKAMSEKQKQMAAALGLEDEIEVDDLIDEIGTIDQKEKEEEEGDSSDSGSSFTGESECMYTPSFASAKPTGRNKLPPLDANGGSLPPLRGVRKPPF